MDFDLAAKRLAKDHSKLMRTAANRSSAAAAGISSRAQREAELRRKMALQRAEEKKARQRELEYQQTYFREWERNLKVRRLGGHPLSPTESFVPVSIHGEGDKITLPPSVLEHLSSLLEATATPWTFRIGVLNPEYVFPSSPIVQTLKAPTDAVDEDDDGDSSSGDEGTADSRAEAYLDELRHKYLAYTHGSVVEFTQEEGQVGLPESLAAALLASAGHSHSAAVRVKRTVDPAGEHLMVIEGDDVDEGKTAGHLAWGAFDVPDMPIEVSLVELPKGKSCTLTPTPQAIRNGFYNLADIKLVLEQSLIRTRATLSVGDVVHTWHRGKKFDLTVSAVTPSTFQAIVCINTDLEVEFGPPPSNGHRSDTQLSSPPPTEFHGGRTLMDTTPVATEPPTTVPSRPAPPVSLLPEPPLDQSEGVCVVQIRMAGASNGRRRFDVRSATVADLYSWAASVVNLDLREFQLVTRYPRQVMTLSTQASSTLEQAGVARGTESMLVERL